MTSSGKNTIPPPTTGLFFGSFNPIHNGHLGLARYLLAHHNCDEIWFVVSPCNPFKVNQELLPEEQRLQLVQAAIAGTPQLKTCDIEFNLPRPSYTIDTLHQLSARYPDRIFTLIIGADNLQEFHRWKNYRELLAQYPVLVYPREGYDISDIHLPNVTLTNAPLFPVSSTEIRRKVAAGEDISEFVPAGILPEVLGLYAPMN